MTLFFFGKTKYFTIQCQNYYTIQIGMGQFKEPNLEFLI